MVKTPPLTPPPSGSPVAYGGKPAYSAGSPQARRGTRSSKPLPVNGERFGEGSNLKEFAVYTNTTKLF